MHAGDPSQLRVVQGVDDVWYLAVPPQPAVSKLATATRVDIYRPTGHNSPPAPTWRPYPALSFINGVDEQSVAFLLYWLVDPRYFTHKQRPSRITKIEKFLRVDKGSLRAALNRLREGHDPKDRCCAPGPAGDRRRLRR